MAAFLAWLVAVNEESIRRRIVALAMVSSLLASMAFTAMTSAIGPAYREFGYPDWYLGAMLSVGGLVWAITGRYWSLIARSKGYRVAIQLSLVGIVLTIGTAAISLFAREARFLSAPIALAMLFAGRVLFGGAYSGVPTLTNAWVAANSPRSNTLGELSKLGAFQGLGMICGPAIGAILSGYGFQYTFVFAAVVPILGVALLMLLPAASTKAVTANSKSTSNGFRVVRPQILLAAFVCMTTIVGAQLTVGLAAIDLLGLSYSDAAATSGLTLAAIGVAIFLSQFLLSQSRNLFSAESVLVVGAVLAGLVILGIPWLVASGQSKVTYILLFAVAGFGIGLMLPTINAIALSSVTRGSESVATGAVSGAMGAAIAIAPVVVGVTYGIFPALAFWTLGSLLLATAAIGLSSARAAK